MIRDNLLQKRPRCHYNHRGKTKQSFNTVETAYKYINKYHLKDLIVYLCRQCNKYHIGHKTKKGG